MAGLCPSKEVDDKWLARQLRPYGVTPKVMRFADKVGRGYDRNELQEVCQRYISRADLDRLKDDVVQPEET